MGAVARVVRHGPVRQAQGRLSDGRRAGSPGTDLGPVGGFGTRLLRQVRGRRFHERVGWLVAEWFDRLTTKGTGSRRFGSKRGRLRRVSGRPIPERGGWGCLYWRGEGRGAPEGRGRYAT